MSSQKNFLNQVKQIEVRSGLTEVVDLGFHSFADSFLDPTHSQTLEPVFPLRVGLDPETGLFQNIHYSDSHSRYNFVEYSYTSSNSTLSKGHWNSYADFVIRNFPKTGQNVLEIGSNDGYLLSRLEHYASSILGVDASNEMAMYANQNGVRTLRGVFGEDLELLENIRKVNKQWNLILANNVLNHSNDPRGFLKHCSELLASDGSMIIEVPYWASLVRDLKFDQIYHEHVSYFTVKSLETLARSCGLAIARLELLDYHGGSLRVILSKNAMNNCELDNWISHEIESKLFEEVTYEIFMEEIHRIKRNVVKSLIDAQEECDLILGIGAAAKANTFLTFCGLNNTFLDGVTDTSPWKIGKLTPFTRLPILHDSVLTSSHRPFGLILAWNIGVSLEENLKKFNANVKIKKWN